MAKGPAKQITLDTAATFAELGAASDEASVGTAGAAGAAPSAGETEAGGGAAGIAGWAIQITDGGSAAGLSFKPQRRLTHSPNAAWVDCAYKDMAASEALVAAGTAMTTVPQLIYVHGDGWDIRVLLTAITGGSIIVEANPMLG